MLARLEIINYLTDVNWKYMNEYPIELDQSKEFKTKIISLSIMTNPELPLFYSKYLLHKLHLRHLPKGILITSNVRQH
jgi:hypothetical protein